MKKLTIAVLAFWTTVAFAPPGKLDVRYHLNTWRNFDPPRPACRVMVISPQPDGTIDFCSFNTDDPTVKVPYASIQLSMAKTNWVTIRVESNPSLQIRQDPDNGNSWEVLLDANGNEVPQPCH